MLKLVKLGLKILIGSKIFNGAIGYFLAQRNDSTIWVSNPILFLLNLVDL